MGSQRVRHDRATFTHSGLVSNAGDTGDSGLIPGWGRSPRGGHSSPLQNSGLGNPRDKEADGPQSMVCRELDRTELT